MAVTFYTVLCAKPGYPVQFCAPTQDEGKRITYGEVQTFTIEDHSFHDPADACGEFEAWYEPGEYHYLHEKQFQAKVKILHKKCRDDEKRLSSWKAMSER